LQEDNYALVVCYGDVMVVDILEREKKKRELAYARRESIKGASMEPASHHHREAV
jgi:hypothetical protein